MNLMVLLEMAASAFGGREAVRSGVDRLSYDEILRAAGRIALEAASGDVEHLVMLDESSLALPIGLFAAAWRGVPFVPLNYRLTGGELESLVEQTAPAFLVTNADRVSELSAVAGGRVVSRETFLERARAGPVRNGEWATEPEDIAVLLFTSGTTGPPKAALLRHKHLVSYILGSVEFGSAGDEEATLVSVPPYHVAGVVAMLSSVYAGRRVVLLPSFHAQSWLDLACREQITHAFVVPTMLARIVAELDARPASSAPRLVALSYGGGRMPEPVIRRAMELFPDTAFTNAYGLTETSSTLALLGPEDHRAAVASHDPRVRARLASVGRTLPGVEVEIRDADAKPVGAEVRGELYVRGRQVSGEYRGREGRVDEDGWFGTRDEGWFDEEGFLFISGRLDDVIVRGGENLSPGEIEDVLRRHPGVADCAVVGIPDEQWGEAVAAMVVPAAGSSPTEADLQAWVRQCLRSSRTPQRVRFCKGLPYSQTGKLLRRKVRAEITGETS